MKRFKKILLTGILVANGIAWLFLLMAAFSDRVSPQFSVFFSYLGLFFPFIVLINLFFLAGWMLLRKWRYCLLCFVVLLLSWGSISTYFSIHFKTKEVPSECIKLLTYNTMRFEHLKPNKKKNPNGVLQYMIKSKADIICIQEYGSSSGKGHLSEEDIRKALKNYPYSRVHELKITSKNQVFGLAIFSKFPILSIRDIPFDSDYNGAFIAELDIDGKKVSIINNHLESNKLSIEERTEYYSLTKDIDSQKLDNFTTKMTKRLTPAYKIRSEQAQTVAKIIKENTNPYMIVCGDFNDTPISYARRTIKGDLKDAFANSGTGLGISFNQYRFLFRIDYIMHSKNIESYNCTVDKIRYSDHYPVWCYLKLK